MNIAIDFKILPAKKCGKKVSNSPGRSRRIVELPFLSPSLHHVSLAGNFSRTGDTMFPKKEPLQ
jgi:hypothetical protein